METFGWTTPFFKLSEKPRVLSAQFGDGYAQDSPDGLNALLQSWELTFKNQYAVDIVALRDFLSARRGAESFYWTTPVPETITVKCRKWDTEPGDRRPLLTLTCTFEQVP